MKKSSSRAFLAAFGLSFIGLSLAALGVVFLLSPTTELFTDASITDYQPDEEDALTVLFLGGEKNQAPAICLLARMDPVRGKIWVSTLLPTLALEGEGGWNTLGEICEKKGGRKAADALSATLGIPVDRYVRMNAEGFSKVADTAGSIEYVLPFSITLTGGIQVKSGRQQMDGRKLVAAILNQKYDDGERQRILTLNDLTVATVNQRINVVAGPAGEALFKLSVNLADTDLSYADYEKARSALNYLANLPEKPANPMVTEGNYNLTGKSFLLSAQSMADIKEAFGKDLAVTTGKTAILTKKKNA